MFGYVIARKETLSEEQLARYRGCYCGLCHGLKEHYGSLHRLALNYDMTFLILVLSALYEPEERQDSKRCAVHPAKPQAFWQNDFTAYGADLTVALTYHKLRDDWLDEGDRLKKGLIAAAHRTLSSSCSSSPTPVSSTASEKIFSCISSHLARQSASAPAGFPAGAHRFSSSRLRRSAPWRRRRTAWQNRRWR